MNCVEAQNELKNQFINHLNQVIYSPITGILDLSQSLLTNYDKMTESQKRNLLRTIIKSSERLEYLVSNVLDLAKLSSHHFVLDTQATNLSEKIREITETYTGRLQSKGSNQSFIISIEEEIFANCDIYYLKQAINNILSNAVNYGQGNPIEISLSKNDNQITFYVKDKGIGIKESEIDDIFKIFFVGSLLKKDTSGVGLTLCQKIIKLHGGNIWARNNKDGGASFTFTIPS